MKKIQVYLKERMQQSKKNLSDSELLLGCQPASIIHFITWKELLKNPLTQAEKVKQLLKKQRIKLVINGNLNDRLIDMFLKMAVTFNRVFSVVVMDGFRELTKDMRNSHSIAILLIHDTQKEDTSYGTNIYNKYS